MTCSDIQGENFNPEFLKVNPKGTVPALEYGGKVYDDSTVSHLASSVSRYL